MVAGVGQAGSQMAAAFWTQLCEEHRIDSTNGRSKEGPTGNWEKSFTIVGDRADARFVPRSLFIDSDPRSSQEIKESWSNLFNPANFVFGSESSGNNFAVAFHEIGNQIHSKISEVLEREFQKPPKPEALIIFHGYGGGSGAGLSAVLCEIFKHYAPEASILSVGILPSAKVSSSVTEPYNATFGVEAIWKHLALGLLFQNDELMELAEKHWDIKTPGIPEINSLIAKILAAMTSAARFRSDQNLSISLPEIIRDLAPHPDFPFVTGTIFPLSSMLRKNTSAKTLSQMYDRILERGLDLCPCSSGTIMSMGVFGSSRGNVGNTQGGSSEPEHHNTELPDIPSFARFHLNAEPPPGSSICILINSSSISEWLTELCQRFDQLWTRRAFANWYLNAGMKEGGVEARRRELGFRVQRYRDIQEMDS